MWHPQTENLRLKADLFPENRKAVCYLDTPSVGVFNLQHAQYVASQQTIQQKSNDNYSKNNKMN